MGNLLNPGKEARRAQEESRRIQAVANDRQLSSLAAESARSGATRRNPRGRRLFVSDAANKTDLS